MNSNIISRDKTSNNIEEFSLPEVFRSVPIAKMGTRWRFFAFLGPGMMVAVGYMDPGNWATDLAAGSAFGYNLLSVIVFSSLMAVLLQVLSLRLGVATGHDLAQMCRRQFPRSVNLVLWGLAEAAIIACDLAEVVGAAIALKLLFGVPVWLGAIITVLDVLVLLLLLQYGIRLMEAIVSVLILTIIICFVVNLVLLAPEWGALGRGLLPSRGVVTDPEQLYLAVGIIGATVMPHNLYLHSALIQTRRYNTDEAGQEDAIRHGTWDTVLALSLAFFVNAAILVLAAAAFHASGNTDVAEIEDAWRLLAPVVGTSLASVLFAVALLAAGQNATVTGTLAGQIIMEGFLKLRLKPWARRMLTRSVAVVPVVLVAALAGEAATGRLLLFSQVVLSMQLPFAIVPLVLFTGSRAIMGNFVSSLWIRLLAWMISVIVVGLNILLLVQTAISWFASD